METSNIHRLIWSVIVWSVVEMCFTIVCGVCRWSVVGMFYYQHLYLSVAVWSVVEMFYHQHL